MNGAQRFLSTILIALAASLAHANEAIPIKGTLDSVVLGEKRAFEVYLPDDGTPEAGRKYDVLYVLDGEWNIELARQMVELLSDEELIPPQIIVSIPNGDPNMRDRDFTPTPSPEAEGSGKADAFIAFLRNELIPTIDQRYPTSGNNTLMGHSYGGTFGMYALLKAPRLFRAYVLADPALQWDHGFLKRMVATLPASAARQPVSLYVLAREGKAFAHMGSAEMRGVLREHPIAGLTWKIVASPDETHNTTKVKALFDGMKFVYHGYRHQSIEVSPTTGIVVAGQPFPLRCVRECSDTMKYTVDGTVPSKQSPSLGDAATITPTGNTEVIVKSVGARPEYDRSTRFRFQAGHPWAPGKPPSSSTTEGLHYEHWDDERADFATVSREKPSIGGVTDDDFDLNALPGKTGGWTRLRGWLEIRDDGYYTFGCFGADAVRWHVGGRSILAYAGKPANGRFESFLAPLQKGFYTVEITVLKKRSGDDMHLGYSELATSEDVKSLFKAPVISLK